MGIRLVRLPEYDLDLNIYSGEISTAELFFHLRRLDSAADWLSYFDATADLSGIDLAHFPALKHAITSKEHERIGGEPKLHALVNVAAANALFVRFWCSYVCAGVSVAHRRQVSPVLEDACRWLHLPLDACVEVAAAIEAEELSIIMGLQEEAALTSHHAAWAQPALSGVGSSDR
jgi:hypothetical protein